MRRAAFVTCLAVIGLARGALAGEPDLPEVRSQSAFVVDAASGKELLSQDADEIRPIASMTKIFVAMAVRRRGLPLDGWTTITKADARAAAGGARTRLDVGQTFQNVDLLRAMLMASDNRAPTALGRAAGMSPAQLIAEMNGLAKDLGLQRTRFTDTSGLRGNVSTAREMTAALRAALKDDVLRGIMGSERAEVVSKSRFRRISYGNTDRSLAGSKFDVVGGKTGYTRSAGYCLVVGAKVGGRRVVMAFLGARGKLTRFADFERVARWVDAGAPGAPIARSAPAVPDTKAVGKARARHQGGRTRRARAAR